MTRSKYSYIPTGEGVEFHPRPFYSLTGNVQGGEKSNFTNANYFQRVYSADGDNKCAASPTIGAEKGLNTGHNL